MRSIERRFRKVWNQLFKAFHGREGCDCPYCGKSFQKFLRVFFDLCCNHVLEHVNDDETAMAELFRVLKPGGLAVLQIPLALNLEKTLEDPAAVEKKDRKRLFGQKDHVRLYGLDYFDKLADAGFRVERDNPFTNKWVPELDTYCLDRNEDVLMGHKD